VVKPLDTAVISHNDVMIVMKCNGNRRLDNALKNADLRAPASATQHLYTVQ